MSFSKKQQGQYRPLVLKAWQAHCKANALALNHPSKRAWYEAELMTATGKSSTAACDAKRDFEQAMAHFEGLCGDSIYWNTRIYGADARRILHEVQTLCRDYDVPEQYLREIARRTLRRDLPPDLAELEYSELVNIVISLKRHVRRHLAEEPF
jgi:hypothetical protein